MASKLEWARLHAAEDVPEQSLGQIQDLEERLERLTERVDFNEKLLGAGPKGVREISGPSAELE